jgi:DNA (cytosine-5)-methyltransferase 1
VNELALFAGAGGGLLAGHLLGWRPVCAVEIDPYCRRVLLARQRDGHLPAFPVWDDVRTFRGRPWRGAVDLVSGGFPCQDISCAGTGAGLDGEKSGLWSEMSRIVREVRPHHVFVENSPFLTSRGLDRVLGDLAEMGFDARWGVLGAHHAGAPHERDRIWIVATNADEERRVEQRRPGAIQKELTAAECSGWWSSEPGMGRVAHGMAHRVDRLRALGNGQVSAVAALAWEMLSEKETT